MDEQTHHNAEHEYDVDGWMVLGNRWENDEGKVKLMETTPMQKCNSTYSRAFAQP